ncbi:MAG: amidohydrolase family protein [Actinomycetota bacterium]|nr:amidohydrolase family protein [Actinomycetota bacterium]
MFDLVIEGGLVVDGTGVPGQVSDVAVAGNRVVALGPAGSAGSSRRRVRAEGLVVAPGFIDIHTHLDAQVFWDPYCTPSSLYGITSVFAGNCGFSIAPLGDGDGGYMRRLLAEVEAIPVEALEKGVPWSWKSFAEYLDAVERARPAVNIGFMAGHSAIRRAVLGEDHAIPDPGDQARHEMQRLLSAAMEAGAMGFSSSWNSIHVDGEGDPVPSRSADSDELVGLCAVLAGYPGSQLEFIPTVGPFTDAHVDLMIRMALAAGAPLNWNVLIPQDRQLVEQQLEVSDRAARQGATIVALTYPGPTAVRASAKSRLFRSVPGWGPLLAMAVHDAVAALGQAETRTELRARATDPPSALSRAIDSLVVTDGHSPTTAALAGRTLGDIASEWGTDAFEVLFDFWQLDRMRTGLMPEPMANSIESWEVRYETWADPRVIIGASDAGAHVHMLSTFDYPAALLHMARESERMSLAGVIQQLTSIPASLYRLADRGRLEVGSIADMVIFDPATVGPGRPGWRDDLPAGEGRIYRQPEGIHHVIVGGTEIVGPEGLTGERPGQVLRRGVHTGMVAP